MVDRLGLRVFQNRFREFVEIVPDFKKKAPLGAFFSFVESTFSVKLDRSDPDASPSSTLQRSP